MGSEVILADCCSWFVADGIICVTKLMVGCQWEGMWLVLAVLIQPGFDRAACLGWKNILSLRNKARNHIWWKIGNGRSVNVWHDRWCSVSPLSEFIDTRDVYDARLRQVQVPIINEENEDTALWVSRLCQWKQFKIRIVWKDMNCNNTKVDWFSTDQIISEIKALPSNKNIWSIVRRLVCGAAVYYIWQERNNRLFKNEKGDSNTILNIVKETVGMKLIGIKVKESRTVKEVEKRWNVKMQRV
ncbi:hypothetical protein Tco_1212628 [Tanacetum coccineum]